MFYLSGEERIATIVLPRYDIVVNFDLEFRIDIVCRRCNERSVIGKLKKRIDYKNYRTTDVDKKCIKTAIIYNFVTV